MCVLPTLENPSLEEFHAPGSAFGGMWSKEQNNRSVDSSLAGGDRNAANFVSLFHNALENISRCGRDSEDAKQVSLDTYTVCKKSGFVWPNLPNHPSSLVGSFSMLMNNEVWRSTSD